ncbi:hypothetical protein EJ05DRAFT_162540 [Pseudovirgaria hyperparasitica]|uniref:Uncharacterized protein n=1 Tax=Pseudovirgaria hyperparasitica TaxID=470096 RepID=A0A6A6VXN7_9PEZI|nr:uncharacterized protein EJ05DRAFT_162540 [Pseudovirgaria hyperparasitica]KAF2754021.1 hypothetical protein EJ05DRAFT_162540 [Pseudovirgaria hyperparasitica]
MNYTHTHSPHSNTAKQKQTSPYAPGPSSLRHGCKRPFCPCRLHEWIVTHLRICAVILLV